MLRATAGGVGTQASRRAGPAHTALAARESSQLNHMTLNDPHEAKAEPDEIVEALKKNCVPAEHIVFPDEGHGFSKKRNQIEAFTRITAFLDKYVAVVRGAAER